MNEAKSAGGSLNSKSAYLILNSQILPLHNKVTRIGRMPDNDLVIRNPLISRYHAEIHYHDGQFEVRDLES